MKSVSYFDKNSYYSNEENNSKDAYDILFKNGSFDPFTLHYHDELDKNY